MEDPLGDLPGDPPGNLPGELLLKELLGDLLGDLLEDPEDSSLESNSSTATLGEDLDFLPSDLEPSKVLLDEILPFSSLSLTPGAGGDHEAEDRARTTGSSPGA